MYDLVCIFICPHPSVVLLACRPLSAFRSFHWHIAHTYAIACHITTTALCVHRTHSSCFTVTPDNGTRRHVHSFLIPVPLLASKKKLFKKEISKAVIYYPSFINIQDHLIRTPHPFIFSFTP